MANGRIVFFGFASSEEFVSSLETEFNDFNGVGSGQN